MRVILTTVQRLQKDGVSSSYPHHVRQRLHLSGWCAPDTANSQVRRAGSLLTPRMVGRPPMMRRKVESTIRMRSLHSMVIKLLHGNCCGGKPLLESHEVQSFCVWFINTIYWLYCIIKLLIIQLSASFQTLAEDGALFPQSLWELHLTNLSWIFAIWLHDFR